MKGQVLGAVSLAVALLAVGHPVAQSTTSNPGAPAPRTEALSSNVSGTWAVSAEGYELSMTLQQEGPRLTGTMQITHGTFPIVGEFRRGRIHFAGVSDGGGIRHDGDSNELDIAAIGRVQPDGTLAGTMVSAVGDFTWRAIRK